MEMKELFDTVKNIAVVGMSKDISKAAHTVPMYMKKQGYNIIPINPTVEVINKMKVYPDINSVEEEIEMLNVFRPSQDCLEIVEQAVSRKKQKGDIKYIWLQLGIINNDSKMLAEENGIIFYQDLCIYVEHKNR